MLLVVGSGIIVISMIHSGRFSLSLPGSSISRLNASRGRWQITLRNGRRRRVLLAGQVLVWPWLVVARFTDQDQTYALVLLPDSVDQESHRRSRVYFRYYAFSG